jgi:hypothetical protein
MTLLVGSRSKRGGRNAPLFQRCVLAAAIFALTFHSPASLACQTLGTFFVDRETYPGYTLFAPNSSTSTFLIDTQGRVVHSWQSNNVPGQSAYLLEDGHLFRTAKVNNPVFGNAGGVGGRVEDYDWNGALTWSFTYSNPNHSQHHDARHLPNGNILMIAWEVKNNSQVIAAGRNPALLTDGTLWPDTLIEVHPTTATSGTIVWEWHLWDHLIQDFDPARANYGVVGDHPERVDLNFALNGRPDWTHANGLDYNETLDQVIVSIHNLSEVWIIDHSTTTAQAASHSGGRSGKGGDLLYRWGNPQAYRAGAEADRRLFQQHNPAWIPAGLPGAGHITIFNNGAGRPGGSYSTVEEIATPSFDANGNYQRTSAAFGPASSFWTWVPADPASFYAPIISGAQRLPNGNTLICNGPYGTFWEVTHSGKLVWKYINPVTSQGTLSQGDPIPFGQSGTINAVFRAYRYGADYAGLAGRDLTPGAPVELNPVARPRPVEQLTVTKSGSDVVLSWPAIDLDLNGSTISATYTVYRDTHPYELPDRETLSNRYSPSPAPNYIDSGAAGNGTLYFYVVNAIGPMCMESD